MPELSFHVEGVEALTSAASPTLAFKLLIGNVNPRELIHTIALRTQIQLEVTRRRYDREEQKRLVDLFGEPERWGQTLRNMLWTNVSQVVTQFESSTVADLQVPCTFDFNVAATKFFHGLAGGEVPLSLLFSGTVFYSDAGGILQAAPIPWDKDARFRMPVRVWQEMMDFYYPNTAWLTLRRDVFDRLHRYKMSHGIPGWEKMMEQLLDRAEPPQPEKAEELVVQ